MSHKQITNWCRDHDIWYLKIDIEIPEVCIQEAQAVYDEGFFVDHNDSNEKRDREGRTRNIAGAINLAFYQPENCYLRRTDTKEELPFENCTGFWFDNGVNHEALNSSNENRFHFIMHGGFNKEREKLMSQSLVKQFGKDVLREIDV